VSPLTKATIRRPRLQVVDEALAADGAALEAARGKISELTIAEDEAVRESKRKDPTANAYKLGSPAQTARAEREKLERSLAGIEAGIAALRAERETAAREEAARYLVDRIEEARDLQAKEREARLAAGKAFGQLAETWNKLAAVLSERNELAARVRHERLLEAVGAETEAAARWEQAAGYVVEPVPTTFAAFLDELLEAALRDRRDLEAERADIDAQNLRRRAFSQNVRLGPDGEPVKPPEGDSGPNPGRDLLPPLAYPAPVSKHEQELAEAVPDLRAAVAKAEISGVPIRRRKVEPGLWSGPFEAA
jgi:hypothetical protein